MQKLEQDLLLGSLNKDDQFFPTIEDTTNAVWNRQWFENYEGYADKYRDAVIGLYENSCDIFDKDRYAYPIMFLSRHCIELRLKSIIHYLKAVEKNKNKHTHSLLSLWNIVDSVYAGEKVGAYKQATQLINELNRYDCKSDTFRYPIHNDNTRTNTAEFINIDVFYRTFRKLDVFLEGIEAELQNVNDIKTE